MFNPQIVNPLFASRFHVYICICNKNIPILIIHKSEYRRQQEMKPLALHFFCMILQNIFKFQAMNCFEIITNIELGGTIFEKGVCSVNMLIVMLCI